MTADNTLVIEKNGQEVLCDICFSFISEDTNKAYIAYTDHSKNINGKENLFVKSYDPGDYQQSLKDVTDDEITMVYNVMNKIQAKL